MSLFSVELHVAPSRASLKEPNDGIVVAEKKTMLTAEYNGQRKNSASDRELNYFKSIKNKSNNVHGKERM